MFRTYDNLQSVCMDVQKFSRIPIVCVTNDLVTAVDAPDTGPKNYRAGRYNNRDEANELPALICEIQRHATIICPDSVIGDILVKNPGGGGGNRVGAVFASKKQTRYVRTTYTPEGVVNFVRRIDEENPITGQLV